MRGRSKVRIATNKSDPTPKMATADDASGTKPTKESDERKQLRQVKASGQHTIPSN